MRRVQNRTRTRRRRGIAKRDWLGSPGSRRGVDVESHDVRDTPHVGVEIEHSRRARVRRRNASLCMFHTFGVFFFDRERRRRGVVSVAKLRLAELRFAVAVAAPASPRVRETRLADSRRNLGTRVRGHGAPPTHRGHASDVFADQMRRFFRASSGSRVAIVAIVAIVARRSSLVAVVGSRKTPARARRVRAWLVVPETALRRAFRRVRARGVDPRLLRVALAREHSELVPLRPEERVEELDVFAADASLVVLQLELFARLRLLQRVQRLAELAPAHQLLALTQELLELGSVPLGLGHQARLEAGACLLERRGVPFPKFSLDRIAPLAERRDPAVPFRVERVPSPRLLLALSAEPRHQRRDVRDVRVVRAWSRAHPRVVQLVSGASEKNAFHDLR